MRSSRMVTYRKNHRKKSPLLQLVIILYAVILSLSQLTSPTSSMFSNTKEVSFTMPSGTWWDGSELLFTPSENQTVNDSCLPTTFSVDIQNNGFSMTNATQYEIFYIEDGNPKDGSKIAEDTLELLEANEVTTISHEATITGFYIVKVFQQPDYAGESEKIIWSEVFEVSCPSEPTETESEEEVTPDAEETVQEPEKEEAVNTAPPETPDEPVEEPVQEEDKEAPTEEADKEANSNPEETLPPANESQEPETKEEVKEKAETEQKTKEPETATEKEQQQSQSEDAPSSKTESQEGETK